MENIFKYEYSQNALKSIEIARSAALNNRNKYVEPIHYIVGIYNVPCMGSQVLQSLNIPIMSLLAEMGKLPKDNSMEGMEDLEDSPESQAMMELANKIAHVGKKDCIYTEDILLASVFYKNTSMYDYFDRHRLVRSLLYKLNEMIDINSVVKALSQSNGGALEQEQGGNNAQDSLPEDLSDLGVDLTKRARENKIDPIIGRKDEIDRIIEILCRKSKNNPVLIGEPGVGKSAVVEGLAREIVAGNVPELLKNKIIFSLDIGSLMAGTKYRGELEGRLKKAIETITQNGNIIVFIDELHTLAQAGGKEGEVTPSDMLKPYLARGELQTIGATTTDEYRKFIEKDKALERRFQPILVNPPTVEQTIEILKGIRPSYENFHKIKITDEAINAAAKLSDRYISDRYLPDKAIDLIDEAASRAKVSGNRLPDDLKQLEDELEKCKKEIEIVVKAESFNEADSLKQKRDELIAKIDTLKGDWQKTSKIEIGEEDIAQVVSKWTKIPVSRLSETEVERLKNLEKILHERVVGQDEAVESVAKAIRRARAGLKDPKRPIGTFLFLGPTGVGKTELTKALAAAMFDDENNIIRIDMSEYMESHSVSKLIGAPPGYVGFDDGGQLTEQVRRHPYSVVLFDEIEKAHPDVYNILLQLLDEGRLTDSQGRLVDFKNTIVIMTSNVGISELKKKRSIGFNNNNTQENEEANDEAILKEALKRHFRPEFLNRIDVICYFKHLTEDNIKSIADIMLKKVTKKLADRNIKIRYTPAMVEYVIKNGYDAEYGARPLRRIIEQSIEDSLAEALLSGKLKDNSTATVDYIDDKVEVTCQED